MYNLFRNLGLRHLMVVPRVENVIGVITRKDLVPEVVERKCPDAHSVHGAARRRRPKMPKMTLNPLAHMRPGRAVQNGN